MDEAYRRRYSRLYHSHWWWRARETILLDEIRKLPLTSGSRILDFGCGNGLFLPLLDRLGEAWGIETDPGIVEQDHPFRNRIWTEPLGSARYDGMRFDLVTALDVLEHVEDDLMAIKGLARMLKPGGRILVTVPALMSVWSHHDVVNRHCRRYSKPELRRLLEAEFEIRLLRYFFHFTYPPKRLVSLIERFRIGGPRRRIAQEAVPPRLLNTALARLSLLEYRWLSRLEIPFGTSLIAVAEKPLLPAY